MIKRNVILAERDIAMVEQMYNRVQTLEKDLRTYDYIITTHLASDLLFFRHLSWIILQPIR